MSKKPCLNCLGSHPTAYCFQLFKKPDEDRINFLRSKNLCYACDEPGHEWQSCKMKNKKCNSAKVLESLPESERMVQDIELFSGNLPQQRTLSLQCSFSTDFFKFVNNIDDKPNIRKEILSVVS